MRDGLLRGDTVMARAWKELIPGHEAQAPAGTVPSGPSRTSAEFDDPDTMEERKALGIPLLKTEADDTEGW